MMTHLLYADFPWWHNDYSIFKRQKALWSNKESKQYEITNKDDEVVVEVEIPGYKSSEIAISYDNRVLDIIGDNEKKGRAHISFKLDYNNISVENSKASLNDGVLIIAFKKDIPKSKQIPIVEAPSLPEKT